MAQIVQMCRAFTEIGNEVTLLVTDRVTHITESPEEYYGSTIKFKVERLRVPDIAGNITKIPPIFHLFAYSLQRLVFAYRASRFIRSRTFDVIYGRDEWILWLLSLLVIPKVVWESHEAKLTFAARRLLSRMEKFVVISEGIRDFYVSRGIEAERMFVAHDAVDVRFFEPHISREDARARLGINTAKPVVMYIGGLEDWKGAGTLFLASKNQSAFEVYVIGGKEQEIELYQQRYPHVHFLGQRPYRELPQNQQAADVLVIPNTGKERLASHYTSPLKLFAHMTSKCQIVASCVPSITNVISDTDATFFAPDDPQSLREALLLVLDRLDEMAGKIQSAYEKSKRYTWGARAACICDFIRGADLRAYE
jgi:glycosyltransferase involved in cell wall biosynthesis